MYIAIEASRELTDLYQLAGGLCALQGWGEPEFETDKGRYLERIGSRESW